MAIHDIALSYGGGAQGMRYEETLHYAVERPFLVLYDQEQYPGPFLKAAVLMEAIIQRHPFTDGNKRTGYLAGITLLELLTGLTVEANRDEVETVCLAVEDEQMTAQGLALWMDVRTAPAD
jgi:death-on-curing protein